MIFTTEGLGYAYLSDEHPFLYTTNTKIIYPASFSSGPPFSRISIIFFSIKLSHSILTDWHRSTVDYLVAPKTFFSLYLTDKFLQLHII